MVPDVCWARKNPQPRHWLSATRYTMWSLIHRLTPEEARERLIPQAGRSTQGTGGGKARHSVSVTSTVGRGSRMLNVSKRKKPPRGQIGVAFVERSAEGPDRLVHRDLSSDPADVSRPSAGFPLRSEGHNACNQPTRRPWRETREYSYL